MVINLDGTRVKLIPRDLDNNGQIGGTEFVSKDSSETSIIQATELGESLKELNLDNIDPITRMSGIDMRARLHGLEIASILAMDALVALKFLPTSCLAFTRQKKRLSVSLEGKGRGEVVDIVAGKKEHDKAMAQQGAIKSFLTPQQNL